PMPSGKIQPEFVERLHGIGSWLERNGEAIYGTRGGPLTPTSWGATTQRDGKIYVHVMDYAGDLLALSKLPPVKSAKVLSSGAAVEITEIQGGIVLRLPDTRDDADTVIVLGTARTPATFWSDGPIRCPRNARTDCAPRRHRGGP